MKIAKIMKFSGLVVVFFIASTGLVFSQSSFTPKVLSDIKEIKKYKDLASQSKFKAEDFIPKLPGALVPRVTKFKVDVPSVNVKYKAQGLETSKVPFKSESSFVNKVNLSSIRPISKTSIRINPSSTPVSSTANEEAKAKPESKIGLFGF